MKFIKSIILFLSFLIVQKNISYSQCNLKVAASRSRIICGDSVLLSASSGQAIYSNDINSGFGNINGQSGASIGRFCDTSGSNYCWLGSNAGSRFLTLNGVNLNLGDNIEFDMKFGLQGMAIPCEGPDVYNEGVAIQYSTNGGVSWTTFYYWDPNGGADPQLTNWNHYIVPFPVNSGGSIQIRWYQQMSSGAGYDEWGLDNIVISGNLSQGLYTWQHTGISSSSSYTPPVYPSVNTTYTVVYTDGINTCSGSVSVKVDKPNISVIATPSTICLGDTAKISTNLVLTQPLPVSCSISPITVCDTGYFSGEFQLGNGSFLETCNGASYSNNGFQDEIFGQFGAGANVRSQILIRASELNSIGFVGGQINNIQFEIGSFYTESCNPIFNQTYPNLTIKMSCTSINSVGTLDFLKGTKIVYTSKTLSLNKGWNTISLDSLYNWDGTSNILIEICYDAGSGGYNRIGICKRNNAGFPCLAVAFSNVGNWGVCNRNDFYNYSSYRPNLKLGTCSPALSNINYLWSPGKSLNDSTLNSPLAAPLQTTTYTLSYFLTGKSGCPNAANVVVNVNNSGRVICPGDTVNPGNSTTLVPVSSGGVFTWYADPTGMNLLFTGPAFTTPALTSTTTYYVRDSMSSCNNLTPVVVFVKTITRVMSNADLKFNIYPVPSTGAFTLDCGNYSGKGKIEITDLLGRRLFELSKEPGSSRVEFNIHLSDGTYFLKFKADEFNLQSTKKLIIRNN